MSGGTPTTEARTLATARLSAALLAPLDPCICDSQGRPRTCDNFLHGFKGAPPARQAGPRPGRVACGRTRKSSKGIASWREAGTARSRAGWQGTRLLRGGSLPRPYGREPSGRGAAAGRLSPLPQAGSPVRNAPTMTTPAELAGPSASRRACSRRARHSLADGPSSRATVRARIGGGFAARSYPGAPRMVRGRPSGLKTASHRAFARRPSAGPDPGASAAPPGRMRGQARWPARKARNAHCRRATASVNLGLTVFWLAWAAAGNAVDGSGRNTHGLSEGASNQVSNNGRRQRWTPADTDGQILARSGLPQSWQSTSLVGFGTKRPVCTAESGRKCLSRRPRYAAPCTGAPARPIS